MNAEVRQQLFDLAHDLMNEGREGDAALIGNLLNESEQQPMPPEPIKIQHEHREHELGRREPEKDPHAGAPRDDLRIVALDYAWRTCAQNPQASYSRQAVIENAKAYLEFLEGK